MGCFQLLWAELYDRSLREVLMEEAPGVFPVLSVSSESERITEAHSAKGRCEKNQLCRERDR